MGINVPPFIETDHRSSIHPASFILYSNRVAVPEMIPYWQGDGLIIRPGEKIGQLFQSGADSASRQAIPTTNIFSNL